MVRAHQETSRLGSNRPRRRGFRSIRPAIDILESRTLLSSVNWTGSGDGKTWTDAANWSDDAVPTSTDAVTINVAGSPTIQISSGSQSVESVDSTDPIAISGGSLTVAATSELSGGLTMTGGSLTSTGSGTTLTVTGTTTVSGASVYADSGSTLSLPDLTNFTENDNTTFEATGAHSTLDLSALTTLGSMSTSWRAEALDGGTVNLSKLTTINEPNADVQFTADGSGSQLNLSALTSFTGDAANSTFAVTNSATVLASGLTTLSGLQITLDGSGAIATSQWSSLTGGGLTITGGSYSLAGLNDVSGSSLYVQKGGTLALPNLTNYTETDNTTFEATGANSTLDLSALTTLGSMSTSWRAEALDGGTVNLSKLTTINEPNADVQFTADGSGSQLNLSALTSFTGDAANSTFAVTNSATVLASGLTTLSGLQITLDGSGAIATSQWSSLTGGGLTITGGSYSLAGLNDVSGSSLYVQKGGTLALPNLTNYTETDNTTFEATGANSTLDLSALTTLGSMSTSWRAEALDGGTVNLSKLTTINEPNADVQFTADGSGSQLNLSALTSFTGDAANSTFAVTNSATVLASGLTTLSGLQITLDGSGAIATSQWSSLTGGGLTITGGSYTLAGLTDWAGSSLQVSGGAALSLPVLAEGGIPLTSGTSVTIRGVLVSIPATGTSGATINFPQSPGLTLTVQNSGTLSGTTFDVGQGMSVVLAGGTYSGGVTFNVAQGASVDLTGGQTTTYGGTLTGSGAGTVQLSSGIFYPADGGATLNFPGSMFQWTGGRINTVVGDVTNLGILNLAGSSDKEVYDDGTLDNFGTIIQTGSGNLGLHSDNKIATTLKIEAGGSYLIESDSGIDNPVLGMTATAVNNAGTIKKTGGTGMSTLLVDGTLTNTGTIEADSGTLYLDATALAQVSSGSLTGGTWNALDGATLEFPSGTTITSNAANVSLGGSGAAITGLSGLATNTGSLTVSSGATLTTTSALNSSGSVTVAAGSSLGVDGNFTQTSAGTLNIQIGGAPAGGQYGQVAVTGAAALGGYFDVALENGTSPARSAVYPVMTFASASGSFAAVAGLGQYLTEQTTPTSLDLETGTGTPVDLELSQASAPTEATTGQQITVNWEVKNTGSNAASGNWQDSVYLSTTPAITSSSVLLGSVVHTGGLSAGSSYNGTLTAAIPAVAPGNYYVLVQADSLDQVLLTDRADDTLVATTGELAVSVPTLTLGAPASDTFSGADQNQYYQISVPAGGSLVIALASAASSGATALYVAQGALPTPYNYEYAANVANQADQTVSVPQVLTAGTYYVLVHSVSGAAATAGYTLTATQAGALAISAISSYAGGNSGNVTVEIDGTNFTPSATATLTLGTTTLTAFAVDFVSSSQLFATFDLAGAIVGNYTLSVQQGGQKATSATAFSVVPAVAGSLNVSLQTPQYIRPGRTATIVVSYSNPTNDDMVAPLLDITSTDAKTYFSTPDDPNDFIQDAQLLAVAPSGPAGIMRPGQSGQLTLTLLTDDTTGHGEIPVQVSQVQEGQSIDWASEEASLQPSNIPSAAWSVIFGNVLSEVGTTTDSYNAALARAATYLGGLGETSAQLSDVGSLWSFLVAQANASFPTSTPLSTVDASLSTPGNLSLAIDRTFVSTIAGRYTSGIFGLGWATSWQTSLSVDSSGNVTMNSGAALAYFGLQANGSYLDTEGEYGTLTKSAGIYTFTDTSGIQYVFLPDGELNYEQDTNGNRITLGYNSTNQLDTLTYSNPADPSEPDEQLTLAYYTTGANAGFVHTVSDGTGVTWTYSYDGAGHLLSVTSPGTGPSGDPGTLTTSYTYDTGTNPETANALLSITNPDGSQQTFTYDPSTGRLTGTAQPDGALTISTTYTYPGEAEVVATDGAGDQTTVWFNDLGLPSRIEDPRGGISTYGYDDNGNLLTYTDAAGDTYQYSYDQSGNLTEIVNPLGEVDKLTYDSLSDLTSLTDADGNITQYNDNSAGNLLSITYPDGTQQSLTYDPLGNMTETIEQNGDPVSYQYNGQGLVTEESFADGSSQTYTYDDHGNLLTASTYSSSDVLTGTTTLTYNAANELLSIAYPDGQYLDFTYNAAGQRTQSVHQDGFTVNYKYDSLGRLAELTDGSGNLIVQYTYNDLGELVAKQNGNGTYTTYAYDKNGNLTNEVNYANSTGSIVNSTFTYAYNSLNEETSVTDESGNTTSYGYDATGQLTEVTLPGGATIQYVYNAAGDRTEVINSGTVTSYSSNSDNEITQVGSATYTYDANGNVATVTEASGTTTYDYNDLNQLVSITNPDGSVQSFQYSPLGFMVGTSTTSGGTTSQTNYLVDPTGLGNVVAAYNGTGSLIAKYTYGLGLVSQSGPSGAGYYDFDASGNTVGITGQSGSYVNQYNYLPFGETTTVSATLPNPFTFVGQLGVMQVNANLFSMRARNYDPIAAQFLSNDPLGVAGGDSDLRRYTENSPIGFSDASGTRTTADDVLDQVNELNHEINTEQSELPDVPGFASIFLPFLDPDIDPYYQTTLKDTWDNYYYAVRHLNQLKKQHEILKNYLKHLMGSGSSLTTNQKPNPRKWTVRWIDGIPYIVPGDPNALIGPSGYGSQGYIDPTGAWSYTVDFENDGTAAAQDVTVTQKLDSNFNWSTFQLGSFGFGPISVDIPPGLTDYETTVPYQNTDGSSLNVQVAADFNVQTGLLTVTYTSLDPLTGQAPAGVFDGFLYAESTSVTGSEGFVQYTVQPKANLSTGTTISQQASVVFDINSPIVTNPPAVNTIDTTVPTSSVAALPATETSPSFTVKWSGSDGSGSGIADYNVYVSDNGGPYTLWQSDTTATSATYAGQVGNTYQFCSVATSNVGLVQPTPTAPQATTKVVTLPPPAIVTSVEWTTVQVKTGSGKKAKSVSEPALEVTFSEPVSGVANLGAFQLSTVTTKTVKKKPVTTLKPIALGSALTASSPRTTSVKLVPSGKLKAGQTYELEIIAADITDAEGRALDGKDNGQPGSNFVAEFGSGGVMFARPNAALTSPPLLPSAVDAVLPSVRVGRKAR